MLGIGPVPAEAAPAGDPPGGNRTQARSRSVAMFASQVQHGIGRLEN